MLVWPRPVTSLGHQEGRKIFREGPKFFELCTIFLNCVQHIFPGGEKFSRGAKDPSYGPGVQNVPGKNGGLSYSGYSLHPR